jgi:YcxB-like protein
MHLLAQYTLTSEEALKGTRAFKRRWYEASIVTGAALLFFAVYSLLAAKGSWGFCLIMALNGLLLLILPEAVLRWADRRRGSEPFPPTEVTLNDDGLTLRTPSSEGGLPWTAFSSIQRHSGFWLFTINRSQAIIFPERALDEGASAELTRFLRERSLLKA